MRKLVLFSIKFLEQNWLLLGQSILLICLIEGVFFALLQMGFFPSKMQEPASMLEKGAAVPESYLHADWYQDYKRELPKAVLNISWAPYVYWKTPPIIGKYINVDEFSHRKTWSDTTQNKTNHSTKVFMFGGSTLWGWGARDEHTIPSYVAKILNEEYGLIADILNLGEIGYVSTQEVINLITELQRGNIPQYVVFYDGLNDMCSALRPGQVGLVGVPWDELERKQAFERERSHLIRKVLHSYASHSPLCHLVTRLKTQDKNRDQELISSECDGVANQIASTYCENVKIVQALGHVHQFQTLFYWQPVITSKNDLTDYERRIEQEGETYLKSRSLFERVDQKLQSFRNENFYQISSILSGHEKGFYIDYFHIDEKGNEVVARKIAKDLAEQFKVAK